MIQHGGQSELTCPKSTIRSTMRTLFDSGILVVDFPHPWTLCRWYVGDVLCPSGYRRTFCLAPDVIGVLSFLGKLDRFLDLGIGQGMSCYEDRCGRRVGVCF